ncbi:MAG: CNNM domain-containing protein [Campylobacterota bacterium]|nr:CNNM domain-containing protein [Campylobacterota bacterium]
MTLLIIYLILAIGISFLCSILEAVLLSTSRFYIDALVEEKRSGAELLKRNNSEIDLSISSILTLNTFAHTLGAAGVGAQAMLLFGEEYMFLISALLTLAILYFSEIIPKTLGALYWQKLAIPSAYIIRSLIIITYPLLKISSFITRLFNTGHNHKVSLGEIKAMADQGEKDGLIHPNEGGMIDNLLDLKSFHVSEIMTPRSVVFSVASTMTVEQFFELDDYESFSRIPIYEETIDTITGMVLLRTLMIQKLKGNTAVTMQELAVPIFAINENIPVSKILELFIKRKEHIFIVQDSFAQTDGIVTLEDTIETVLGAEIVDEFDNVENMQSFAKLKMRQKSRH